MDNKKTLKDTLKKLAISKDIISNIMVTTADDALEIVSSGDNVYIHSVAAAPQALIKALTDRANELRNVNIYHLHTEGKAPYAKIEFKDSFKINALFIGKNVRDTIQEGRGSYIPIFLSEIPTLFRKGFIPIDIALITVSPPDLHGFCSLGVSVDATRAAVESAKFVIAQVNKHMPRTHGDGLIHISEINRLVECDEPIPETSPHKLTEVELAIGRNVAELIEDGATLQMGIGAIPNAVLASLTKHKDLGIHTEMLPDGIIPLVEKGIITGKKKRLNTGEIVATFVWGPKKLYDFVDDNPLIVMLDVAYVNDAHIIRQNPKVIAINSAIEIDFTGQVCADSIGKNMYSGVGGQMDFIRGASLSEGGKPIIALPSITKKGVSKIVPFLKQGAGVVTTRAHVHYVVTEWGSVNLYGKTLKQRARALINIAHPDNREELEKQAFDMFKGYFS